MRTSIVYLLQLTVIGLCWLLPFWLSLPDNQLQYAQSFYEVLQQWRIAAWRWIPFSIGDLFYILLGMFLLLALASSIRQLVLRPKVRGQSVHIVADVALLVSGVYALFQLGWGINYQRNALASRWQLNRWTADTIRLHDYEQRLVSELNALAPGYRSLPLDSLTTIAAAGYHSFTNCRMVPSGLLVKPSLFGWWLSRVGIEGYYNPFTGEGQVDDGLPAFLLPFIITHEMAHQAGIASESDANLLAYALCRKSTEPAFRYSASMSVWLYVHGRMRRTDSLFAKGMEARLNPLSRRHLDTVRQIYRRYHRGAGNITTKAYDNYLRLQAQKEGINAYADIVADGWALDSIARSADSFSRYPIY